MIRQISLRFLTFVFVSLGFLTESQAQVVLIQQAVGGSAGVGFSATLPSAPTPNNLLIAIAATRNAGLITPPTGWSTAVNHSGTSGFTSPNQAIFYKVAGVSESATVTATTTANGSGHRNVLQVYEYSGIDTALPFDAANTVESQGTGTTVSSGDVSTNNANDLIIAGLVSRAGTSLTSWANSFTQRNSFVQASTLFGGADTVVTTSGTYSTAATADASGQWRGVIAAFRAATVAPPPPPTISSLIPTSGPTAGGTSVTIDGSNLSSASSVTFGGTAAAITANTATQITVTAPAGPAGAVDVAVTTVGGSATLAGGYTYVAAPSITSLSATSGPTAGGTSLTIDGTNLSGATSVTFGGAAATITANTSNQITVTTPAGTAGTVDVVVTTVGGSTTLPSGYTYVAAPSITSLSTTSGPTAGGTSVTIDGTNLSGATSVTFGGAAATITANTSSQITVTAPAGAAGTVDVVVTTVGGSTTLPGGYTYVAAPSITSLSATSGPTAGGTTVTIDGTNLSGASSVTFGGVAATITTSTSNQITVTTPAGGAGAVDVVVTTVGGSATLPNSYTYVAAPALTSLSPTTGPTAGGTSVTIDGTNLSDASSVTFGGVAATITTNTSNQITVTTPTGAAGAVDVVVTTVGGSATLPNSYTYVAPPALTSQTPTSGPTAGGTSVTIDGTNLGSASSVTFGGAAATITTNTSNQVTVTAPAGAAGAVDVVVTTVGGSATLTNGYTYVAAPTLTSLNPTSGPTAGGTSATIDGTNLSGASSVTFGGVAATITTNTSNQITVTTPAGAAGAVDVAVTTVGGSATLPNSYAYVAPPTLTSLNPTTGPTAGGTSVTIDGTNLSGASSVTFGGTAATITANTSSQITVTTPPGAAGAVNVVVTTVGGSATLTNGYTYVAAPTLTSLNPTTGPIAGGTSVTIDGTNLSGASSVTFGGAAATITANTSNQITVTTPAGAAGAVDVAVTTVGGSATLPNSYTYVAPPTLTSLNPTTGPTAGGTSVTIDGTNLSGASSVTFGGTAATITANTSSQITVTTPAGAAGAVDVAVTTVGGSATLPNGYTYGAAPTITSLSPTSGPTAGGTSVTIDGTNLSGASSVTFGGAAATITTNTATQITVTTPAGSAGAANVVVTTVGGSATRTAGYTYVAAPTVTSLNPTNGPTVGGASVTIDGTNLSGASSVTFGGTTATIAANTATQITITTPARPAGVVNVVVTTAGGSATLSDSYTYVATPFITSLSPGSALVGDPGTTLTISGGSFQPSTTVLWNGLARDTAFLSDTQLSASVSASDFASAGIARVSAMAAGGGAQSGTMTFLIKNPSGQGLDLSSLVLTPRILVGGNSSSGTVTLAAPAPPEGALVTLSSSDPVTAAVPEAVLIPAGESTGVFSVQTLPVTKATPIVIGASIGGVTRTAKLVVTETSDLTSGTKMFVPIVLSAAGQMNSFFISELTLTNRGATNAILDFDYHAAFGEGTGFASDVLLPGEQRIVPDAMAYLRSLGVPIPEQGNRGGTLRITAFDLATPTSFAVTVRTATRNHRGRAAVAFSGVPRSECLTTAAYIFGLRQDDSNRSNVAVQNAGDSLEGDIVLRLTVFSGDPATSPQVLPELTLTPGQFQQISGILVSNGLSLQRGYVRVERVQGTAPYYAYGVVNDQSTSDGSFIPPVLETSTQAQTGLILPALVKTSNFLSELVLANHSEAPKTLNLSYVPEGGGSGAADSSVELQSGEQMFVADFIEFLRERGVTNLGAQDEAVVGTLLVRVAGNDAGGIFAGARTMTTGDERYGVFYTAVPLEKAATSTSWIYNLQQDQETRSNVAIVNTGENSPDADVFRIEIFDGQTGLLANAVDGVSVGARDRIQIGSILSDFAPGVSNGYICVIKTNGTNPFIAYGVVNDGGQPGAGTGDGTYLSMDTTP